MFEQVMYEDSGPAMNATRDLVNIPVAVQCCGGLLRHGPIARCGIQIRVDRTGLDVVDGDTAATDLPGQTLSKDLHSSLGGRVGYQPGGLDAVTYGRAD